MKTHKILVKSVHIKILAVICLTLVLAAVSQAEKWDYWVNEHVAVNQEVITFGQMAEPRTDRARSSWEEVKDLKLWKSPRDGQRVVLTREQVKNRLMAVNPDLGRNSVIPAEIIFQRGARVYGAQELEELVRRHLEPRVRALGEVVEFRDFRLPGPIYLENAYEKIEVEAVSDPGPGRISLRISLVDAHGNISRRLSGNVFVDVWQTVACADRPLNRGQVIGPEDVRFERKNLAYVSDEVWDGRTGPRMVRSSIGQGQPILKRDLEAVPVVIRGDQVDLVYQGRNITLSVPVEVLEDGGAGDRVTVRNVKTRKEIIAVVQDGGTVTTR
ncbi:MAG: flagellar basal body P-ring formation chaperone FlgA [Desulfonatronovibrionaceae bacterium]